MMRRLFPVLLMLALLAVPTSAAATSTTAEQVDGGAAATQATAVEPGTTYTDDVRSGEARWFSFDVGAGQVVGATLTEYGEEEYGCCLGVRLHGPEFDQLAAESTFNDSGTATTLRVEGDEDGVDTAGTYYLEVVLDKEAAIRPVSFEFTVDVSGAAVGDESASAEPSNAEAAASETTPETSEAEASDAEAANPATTAAATGSDDGDGLLWVVVGLLTVLVLLLVAALVFMYGRLQKQRPQG